VRIAKEKEISVAIMRGYGETFEEEPFATKKNE